MTEPTTVNVGIIIPNTGDLPGTWGSNALNPDFVAIDGFQAGVQTISVSGSPITLSGPASFTPTPGPGPTQAQNAVLRFTGAQTANVTVSLPLPGYYIVENSLSGNVGWVLTIASGISAGEYICIDRGMRQHIYHDGTNVRFVNLGAAGQLEMWAGYSAMPAWVSNCSVPPYLLCDGSIYSYSTYPVLGNRFGGAFGGNGVTTFGVPDLRGRVPLAYDGTGSRITSAGSGLSGTTLGAALDQQTVALSVAQLPTGIQSSGSASSIGLSLNGTSYTGIPVTTGAGNISQGVASSGSSIYVPTSTSGSWAGVNVSQFQGSGTLTSTSNNTGGQGHNNVQPSQVVGVWVIRAA